MNAGIGMYCRNEVRLKDTIMKLWEGHERFRSEVFPQHREDFQRLAGMQQPDVLFITCSDSRVVPDLILQSGPGDLFVCRNAGNVVPPWEASPERQANDGVSATIEYAVKVLGVGHIVICGHSDCGAARAVFEQRDVSQLPMVSRWLKYVEAAEQTPIAAGISTDEPAALKQFICANVRQQLENLRTHPEVHERVSLGTLQVHGWFYEIGTGAIEVIDAVTGEQRPLGATQ